MARHVVLVHRIGVRILGGEPLGDRLMAGRRILVPTIGVRIPVSQPLEYGETVITSV